MNSRQNIAKSAPCFSVDALEDRRLMSAACDWLPGLSVWDTQADAVPTVAMPAAPKASPIVKANNLIDVSGNWAGTAKIVAPSGTAAVSMQITSQRGAGATGTFSLGPITSRQTIISTAVVGTDRSFKAVFQGSNFYGSISATISANGQQILGRWACNTAGKWLTGTVLMEKFVKTARR